MKNNKTKTSTAQSKPTKILLHLAKTEDDWAGKAIDFGQNNEYRFLNLTELMNWLKNGRKD